MYRIRIRSTCRSALHLVPLDMKYAGQRRWRGQLVHVMVCPACDRERFFVYTSPSSYLCVGEVIRAVS